LYERGQRVALRDHQREVTDVQAARGGTLLGVKRLPEGACAARTLTMVPELEDGLRIQALQPLRFAVGNPIRLQQLHDALSLTMAHGRGSLVAVERGRIKLEAYQLIPVLKALRLPRARLLSTDSSDDDLALVLLYGSSCVVRGWLVGAGPARRWGR
jgi:hypothetical protein